MPLNLIPQPLADAKGEARSVDLGLAWESGWKEFGTSLRDFLTGPRPLKESELTEPPALRVDWIRGRIPGRAFLASCLWHVVAVVMAILPIWGFLPAGQENLKPIQIESTLYFSPADIPRISLPRPRPPAPPEPSRSDTAQSALPRGTDAFHPHQTILTVPVQVTHPRQTLIQPEAPSTPPKVEPQLPNIVQWAAFAPAKPQLQLLPTSIAPRVRARIVKEVAVPEVANNEKNAGALNIASSPSLAPQPQMPISPMTAAKAQQRTAKQDNSAAPDIGLPGDANLRRIIALSSTPGPPAPEVSPPPGNLAARISISPQGAKPGTPGAAGAAPDLAAGANPNAASKAASGGPPTGNLNSLPAAVSVSAAGLTPAGSRSGKLNLKPPAPPDFTPPARTGPPEVAALDPSLPSEKILSGKEVYSMDVNMPNLTSAAGSWVLYFAQLDEGDPSPLKPKGRLASPVPTEKVDPKYPQDLIHEHVDGEVVLYAIIRKDGSVDSIQVVRSIDPRLDKNAMSALSRWKFRPGARDGVPVDLEAVVHIPFRFRTPQNY